MQKEIEMTDVDKLNSPLLAPCFLPGASDEPSRFQGIPGVEVTPGGNRFAVWYGGGDGEGPENYLMVARCTPQLPGEWPVVLRVDHPGREIRCFDAGLWLDPAGNLRLFWSQSRCRETGKDVSDGVNGVWQSVCAAPDAPVLSWSRPERICDGIMLNKPTVAANGDWLLPVSVWGDGTGGGRLPESLRAYSGANLFVSEDGGRSFHRRGLVRVEEGRIFDEHLFVERRDGSLLMLIRTLYGIAEAVSADGGRSWTPPRRSRLRGPGSRFALRRLKSGALLLVNHRCDGPFSPVREKLEACLSDDDGASWTPGMMIDPRTGVSYPDFAQQSDGTILCVYDRDRYGAGEILLAEFTEADLRAGSLPHPPRVIHSLSGRPETAAHQTMNKQEMELVP